MASNTVEIRISILFQKHEVEASVKEQGLAASLVNVVKTKLPRMLWGKFREVLCSIVSKLIDCLD